MGLMNQRQLSGTAFLPLNGRFVDCRGPVVLTHAIDRFSRKRTVPASERRKLVGSRHHCGTMRKGSFLTMTL